MFVVTRVGTPVEALLSRPNPLLIKLRKYKFKIINYISFKLKSKELD